MTASTPSVRLVVWFQLRSVWWSSESPSRDTLERRSLICITQMVKSTVTWRYGCHRSWVPRSCSSSSKKKTVVDVISHVVFLTPLSITDVSFFLFYSRAESILFSLWDASANHRAALLRFNDTVPTAPWTADTAQTQCSWFPCAT